MTQVGPEYKVGKGTVDGHKGSLLVVAPELKDAKAFVRGVRTSMKRRAEGGTHSKHTLTNNFLTRALEHDTSLMAISE